MMPIDSLVAQSGSSNPHPSCAAQGRIEAQMAIVATLRPGSPDHRVATSVLLMLQDSLFVMSQAEMLLKAVRQHSDAEAGNA